VEGSARRLNDESPRTGSFDGSFCNCRVRSECGKCGALLQRALPAPPAEPAAPAPAPPELLLLPLSDAAPLGEPVIAPELRDALVPEFIELELLLLGLLVLLDGLP
jgi:hypothetical protein